MGMSIDFFHFMGKTGLGFGEIASIFFHINESMNLSHILFEKRSKIVAVLLENVSAANQGEHAKGV